MWVLPGESEETDSSVVEPAPQESVIKELPHQKAMSRRRNPAPAEEELPPQDATFRRRKRRRNRRRGSWRKASFYGAKSTPVRLQPKEIKSAEVTVQVSSDVLNDVSGEIQCG